MGKEKKQACFLDTKTTEERLLKLESDVKGLRKMMNNLLQLVEEFQEKDKI